MAPVFTLDPSLTLGALPLGISVSPPWTVTLAPF
jgi:hypothetical protein